MSTLCEYSDSLSSSLLSSIDIYRLIKGGIVGGQTLIRGGDGLYVTELSQSKVALERFVNF
jgi:hypothetical protein